MDLMSETEMTALIKLVWLAEIGSLLLGKENRKSLHKQRKMALAKQKNRSCFRAAVKGEERRKEREERRAGYGGMAVEKSGPYYPICLDRRGVVWVPPCGAAGLQMQRLLRDAWGSNGENDL
ncbi:hypothetical protein FQN60_007586 [Etheostoma spectabile]|uniref:Uncharacterized protein n=1 Tax=Etheostoma spectabile TaxID=54343 RepID=A0A5J5CW65_9PERO|nr:hypothetical protein FQN60_007586 [Etheostoma spectabile]